MGETVSGRHRPDGGPLGRRALRTPLAVVAVAALVAITAVAVRVVAADARGCSGGVPLNVAAAPEIAPVLEDVAEHWQQSDPDVNGKCIRVRVQAAGSADVANSLAVRGGGTLDVAAKPPPTPTDDQVPAVWIPDSTAWLGRVHAVDRAALSPDGPSIAMSPVVFAAPESLVKALPPAVAGAGAGGLLQAVLADAQKVITQQQTPTLQVGLVDPRRDTAGLAGAMLVRDLVVTDPTKRPTLIALYRAFNRGRTENTGDLAKAFAQQVRVAPMSEQAVLAFNGASPNTPLFAMRLDAGAHALDYPYAVLNGKPREVDLAANKFRTALLGEDFRGNFAARGFRSPDGSAGQGFPVGHGVNAEPVAGSPLSDPARVVETLGLWGAANSPSRALAIIDLSASMNTPMIGRDGVIRTRLSVLQAAATGGLRLFTDTSSLGMWTYASGHSELAPIMPLSTANRNTLNAKIAGVRAAGSDESLLFDTLRDAYDLMTRTHDPSVANRIIVFTDGRSSIRDIKDLEQLSRRLENIAVVTKPIEVTLIGVGPAVDRAELEEIARMTGGGVGFINDAADIQNVFLDALLE